MTSGYIFSFITCIVPARTMANNEKLIGAHRRENGTRKGLSDLMLASNSGGLRLVFEIAGTRVRFTRLAISCAVEEPLIE
jgi:hypothetical protein